MRLIAKAGAVLATAVLPVLLVLAFVGLGTADPTGPGPGEAREIPEDPDVTFYVVGFHWGWAVFDEEGREFDDVRVAEGTSVELYAVNPHAQEAVGQLPEPVAAVIRATEWDGERVEGELEAGRLPDPRELIGMTLQDVLAAGHDDGDVHAEEPEGDVHAEEPEGDVHAEEPEGDVHAEEPEGDVHDEEPEGDVHDEEMQGHRMPWLGEERELETHGFVIPWYGVAEKLEPDATAPVRVAFVADRAGTFEFVCTVYCGWGHEYQPREMLFVGAA